MLALRPCAAPPRPRCLAASRAALRCAPARQPRARRVYAAPEGDAPPPEGPKEPADDPSRPASAGRPAYDEDRAALYGFDKPQGSRTPPKREGRRYGDDGVSGGQYGYGKTVDTAFKYLASEGTFLLGALVIVITIVAVLANGPPPSLLD